MATKKTFTEDLNNPALAFLSGEEAKKTVKASKFKTVAQEDRLKEYMKELKEMGIELKRASKDRRVQLVMTEDLYNAAKAKIENEIDPITGKRLSFNQYITNLVQADLNT